MQRYSYAISFGSWLLAALVVARVLGACQSKKIPVPVDNEPVFYFSGKLGEQLQLLEAGREELYMYTDYQASGDQQLLAGKLAKTNCSNCGPSLGLRFLLNSNDSLSKGIIPWQYQKVRQGDWRTIKFTALDEKKPGRSYKWIFDDGQASTRRNPIHQFPGAGTYEVCLTIEDKGECQTAVCNTIQIDTAAPNATFEVSRNGNRNISLVANHPGYQSYRWDLGNGDTLMGSSIDYTYEYHGFYEVCLTVAQANGNQISFCREVSTRKSNDCTAGFNYQVVMDTSVTTNGVAIQWQDEQNHHYSTTRTGTSPATGQFEVINIEPYADSKDMEGTRKVDFTMDAFLYNQADPTDSIKIETDTICSFAIGFQP